MKKYYFENEDAYQCFTKEYFIDEMKENNLDEMKLYEAVRDDDSEFFWCQFEEEAAEKSETTCGKDCEAYKPRNGKGGICKYKRHLHEFGRELIMKASGSVKYIEE